jgi:lipopolysaccharide transport system permease protein
VQYRGMLSGMSGEGLNLTVMLPTYQIIKYRTLAELRAEVRRGYLGILWWIIEPLLYMSVFFALFAVGLRGGGVDAVPFLLTGLVTWKWFAVSVNKGVGILELNANVIKQINLPIFIFPSVAVIVNTFKFLIVFLLLIVFLVCYTTPSYEAWWSIPIILAVQLVFITSLTFWIAAIVPIIPDLQYVVPNCLLLLFFLSGVFFDISTINEQVRPFLLLNPMALLIDSYRSVLVYGTNPNFVHLSLLFVFSVIFLYSGCLFLSRYAHEYPKIIR